MAVPAVVESRRPVWHNQAILDDVEFYLDGNLRELERLAAELARFCRENALDDDAEFQLNLALEELFVNAVSHGGCEGVSGAAHVRLRTTIDGVEIEFADKGRPFDPTSAPAPSLDTPLEERLTGGLGIHLVRAMMRDLNYRRAGEWNLTTMKRPAAQTVPDELP